jgi:uncharacterized alkaline shock family protein YloU
MTHSPRHVVASTARGATSITSWVIGLVGTEVALRVPGVSAVGEGDPKNSWDSTASVVRQGADGVQISEVDDAAVSLHFALRVRPVYSLLQLAEAVRSEVIGELRRQADLDVSEVNIVVNDIDFEEYSAGAELSPRMRL